MQKSQTWAVKSFLHVVYRHILDENGIAMESHINMSLVFVKGCRDQSFSKTAVQFYYIKTDGNY